MTTPHEIAGIAERLREAAASAPPLTDRAALLSEWARSFGPDAPAHAHAVKLAAHAGLPRAAADRALHSVFGQLLDPKTLIHYATTSLTVPGSRTRVLPPRVIYHHLAGNLFLAGLQSLVRGLLLGAGNLLRCSAADPHLPPHFISTLADAAPPLAALAQSVTFPHDATAILRAACAAADAVVAFGSDAAVADVRAATPVHVPFVPHGERIAVAVVAADALTVPPAPGLADAIALAFTLYDQSGCLSPRALFLETTDPAAARNFAAGLLPVFRSQPATGPRQALDLPARAALARTRDEALIARALDPSSPAAPDVLSETKDDFLLVLQPDGPFSAAARDRTCLIHLLPEPQALVTHLRAYSGRLSAVGIAGDSSRYKSMLDDLRAPRICPIGALQDPPLEWTQDGRIDLRDLVTFQSLG